MGPSFVRQTVREGISAFIPALQLRTYSICTTSIKYCITNLTGYHGAEFCSTNCVRAQSTRTVSRQRCVSGNYFDLLDGS